MLVSRFLGKAALLSLDEIAWWQGTIRRDPDECKCMVLDFIRSNENWIIEGCYADLISHALPFCDELRFLNPGVESCREHARKRTWEPQKFASEGEQNAMLPTLLEWIAAYGTRTDEFGLARHRSLFDSFRGAKHEYTNPAD